MFKFEIIRYIKKKHLLLSIISIFIIFVINFVFELGCGEINSSINLRLNNLSQAICQFSIISLLPILSDMFSYDYFNKNMIFYMQNDINLQHLYIVRVIVYNIMLLLLYILFLLIYFYKDISKINSTTLFIFTLDLFVVISCIDICAFCSMLFKKKSVCITIILIIWITSQIINSLNIPYISGNLLPIDNNNNVALYIKYLVFNKPIRYKNLINNIPVKIHAIFICLVWSLIPFILGIIISKKRISENSV